MEDVPKFLVMDYVVMCMMLCVSSGIGIYFAWRDRRDQSTKTFLMGNRELGVFPVAMSLMASFQSATTVLGYPAEMFYKGTQFWVAIFGLAISNVIAAELFLPVLYNLQLTSVNTVSLLSSAFRRNVTTLQLATATIFWQDRDPSHMEPYFSSALIFFCIVVLYLF